MPPRSSISFCSGSRSITGCGVSGSISVEFAPSRPSTCRANSETATCIPRQMPRYGIRRSRATRQARIFPSQPREPKPPGTSTPSTCSSSRVASSSDMPSASTQRTRTRQPWWAPACFSASCTDRYASWSFTYLPTSAISTSSSLCCIRSVRSSHSPEVAPRPAAGRASRTTSRSSPSAFSARRDEVDVRHVGARDHRVLARRRRTARSSRGCRATALRASGRRRCPGGYRCGAAR